MRRSGGCEDPESCMGAISGEPEDRTEEGRAMAKRRERDSDSHLLRLREDGENYVCCRCPGRPLLHIETSHRCVIS